MGDFEKEKERKKIKKKEKKRKKTLSGFLKRFINSSFSGHSNIYSHYASSTPVSTQHYSPDSSGQTKTRRPRRPWTRAVFSNLQRKGLEKRFQVQKYLTKTDRHQLASMLGLSDNQVKVWFQNRRMKWRQDARESVTSTNTEEGE